MLCCFIVSVSEIEALFELFKSISRTLSKDGLVSKVKDIKCTCYHGDPVLGFLKVGDCLR